MGLILGLFLPATLGFSYQVNTFKAANGLAVYHVQLKSGSHGDQTDSRFFKFSTLIWAGSVDETSGYNEGVAHLLEHLLFERGEKGSSGLEQNILGLGGSYNGLTYKAYSRYFISMPREHLETGMQNFWPVLFSGDVPSEKLKLVRDIIDRENDWSEPTWIDQFTKIFSVAEYLQTPGFWQRQFNLADYDRPVSGRKQYARHLTATKVEQFFRRYYTVPNMVAVYVGPHSLSQVKRVVNRLAKQMPGLQQGKVNLRAKQVDKQPPTFRLLDFEDKSPAITLGYSLNSLGFEDVPLLTLYTETMKRLLYEAVRHRVAQTYRLETEVDIFRGSGFVTYRSQSSRSGFSSLRAYMQSLVFVPFDQVVSKEAFQRSKKEYVEFVKSRIHKPDVVEAYANFLLREHPNHSPTVNEVNWLRQINSVSYEQIVAWTDRQLLPDQRYVYLEAPSLFVAYEAIPLAMLTMWFLYGFWRSLLMRPENIRNQQFVRPVGKQRGRILNIMIASYAAYVAGQHLLFLLSKLLNNLETSGVSLYLCGYIQIVVTAAIVISVAVFAGMTTPWKVMLTKDRFTVKSIHFFSHSCMYDQIDQVYLGGFFQLLKRPVWPQNLFVGRAIWIKRKKGCPLVFSVREPEVFLERFNALMEKQKQEEQQMDLLD